MSNHTLFWLIVSVWFSIFVFLFISVSHIREKLSSLELKFIPIDVHTEMMYHNCFKQLGAIQTEILTIKAMLQLQELRARDKSEGENV